MSATEVQLPPGQRPFDDGRFPRFGTDLSRPAPSVADLSVLAIRGAVTEAFDVPLTELAALPRVEVRAALHCVTGWSAIDLCWEGVSFEAAYRAFVVPALRPDATVTHLRLVGLDRYESVVALEDALADGVLLADRLDGEPLDGDHGAPLRFVSPDQYGYVSTKHLCRIEVHTAEPKPGRPFDRLPAKLLFPHPRARVWEEERHRYVPGRLLRRLYRATIEPLLRTSHPGDEGPAR